jgi:peptidoglycan hydrolase CwlO-like protein
MKKIFFLFFFSLLFLFLFNKNIPAIECEVGINLSGRSREELQEIKNKCEEKLSQLAKQRNTLASEISYIDTQIYLTNLKVAETENKIEKTEKEIGLLNERIEGLDESLNILSKLLLKKIVADYKNKRISLLSIFLEADRIDDLVNRIKYIKTTRENNQKLIIQVQNAKINFEEQKKLREEKKIELDNLKTLLAKQKTELLNQQNARRKLLADTQNSEVLYQRIVAQARAQLASFISYVRSRGGANILSNQTSCDNWGCYYNQRDSQWGNFVINNSYDCNDGVSTECSIAKVGCLVTSVAMYASHLGYNITPLDIASNSDNFAANTALLINDRRKPLYAKGIRIERIPIGGRLSPEIVADKPVIVGINYGPYGTHFLLIKKYENGNYIMNDPFIDNGKDKNFTDYYSLDSIFSIEIISI